MESLGPSENRDDWQTWPMAGREAHHQAHVKAWGAKQENWSGSGKHVKDIDVRFELRAGEELGMGARTFVDRIIYRGTPLARKKVRGHQHMPISKLREEVDIMERLIHKHIVSLIGSYSSTSMKHTLYLLLYPAATCNLKTFLADIDEIKRGVFKDPESSKRFELAQVSKRFEALGFRDVLPQSRTDLQQIDPSSISWHEPMKYLRSIIGCITEALAFVHQSGIRHRDLKPENILLTPKRAYLADFGISQKLEDSSNSLTEGWAAGTRMYQPPEACEKRPHGMAKSDVYSLGAVFLGVATVVYGESLSQFDSIMKEIEPKLKASRIVGFLDRLRHSTYKEERKTGSSQQDCDQCHIIDLVETMLNYEPESRPTALEVVNSLVELGGKTQPYFEECCRQSPVKLANVRGSIIKSLQNTKASQTQKIRDLEVQLLDFEKRGKELEQELEIVRNGFNSRIEKEKDDIANLWRSHFEKERSQHEASKEKMRKLEEENSKLKSRKRNHALDSRKSLSPKRESPGTSTPSRLPVMRNSSSPLIPPKPMNSAKSETNLTINIKSPPQAQRNDDGDSYSAMTASGMTLVGSFSSVSSCSSTPPSPSTSKTALTEIPKIKVTRGEIPKSMDLSNVSKSYADMLRPTSVLVKSGMNNGDEKSSVAKNKAHSSLRGPGAWKNKAT